MEYIFGTDGEFEILRTKGGSHTKLTGYHQLEQSYPDQNIVDNFHIVKKTGSAEDTEGNCYDWYVVDHHYRMQDKTVPIVPDVATNAGGVDELGGIVSDLAASVDDLATTLSDISERLAKLEGGETK